MLKPRKNLYFSFSKSRQIFFINKKNLTKNLKLVKINNPKNVEKVVKSKKLLKMNLKNDNSLIND